LAAASSALGAVLDWGEALDWGEVSDVGVVEVMLLVVHSG
jgi:hypothetical protein